MSRLEEPLQDCFERLVPAPGREESDWEEVVLRATRLPDRRRRWRPVMLAALLIVAVLVGAVVTPLGRALAAGLGDFSAWLRGEPGDPAALSDQAAFERANQRSYAGFPRGTQLRRLIETEVNGHRYQLFGFRAGNSLCLRLLLRSIGQPRTGCAPVAELERAVAPAVVVLADASLGKQDVPPTEEGYVPALAAATFGIVADGVREVELVDDAGRHQALIGGNAFLLIADRPKLGQRTRSVFAVGANGRRLRVPLAQAPYGELGAPSAGQPGNAPGPTRVERVVKGGKIGWLERREPRGEAPPPGTPFSGRGRDPFDLDFARVLTPDPDSHMRILIAIGTRTFPGFGQRPEQPSLCVFLLSGGGAGGGCNPLHDPFPGRPFMSGLSQRAGGDQFSTLHGGTSDDVDRLELFLAEGARVAVPLRDNVFLVQVPRTQFPVRLVAYDSDDRVIGIDHWKTDPVTHTGPRPVGPWRLIATAQADTGEIARLRLARGSNGGTCFTLRITGGAGGSGCSPRRSFSGPPLQLGGNNTPTAQFLSGPVQPGITQVDLLLDNGNHLTLPVVEGFVLAALPAARKPVEARGLDSNGATVVRHRFRTGP
jgi:hypothetical protein